MKTILASLTFLAGALVLTSPASARPGDQRTVETVVRACDVAEGIESGSCNMSFSGTTLVVQLPGGNGTWNCPTDGSRTCTQQRIRAPLRNSFANRSTAGIAQRR